MITKITDFFKSFGVIASFMIIVISTVLGPLGLDNLTASYAFLGTAGFFAIFTLFARTPLGALRSLGLLSIVAIVIGLGYLFWWLGQPRFEITALDTLEDDKNAFEVTDSQISHRSNLDEYGVSISYTLEIRPNYFGKQRFGKVIALISGEGAQSIEITLWPDFSTSAGTQEIQLSLEQLLSVSGLERNSATPDHLLRSGETAFEQATLTVQIAQAADKSNPWTTEAIIIRNAPWDVRAALVWRNNERQADVFVKNLGGIGEFTVHYRPIRVDGRIDNNTTPASSGIAQIEPWNSPQELVRLEKGDYFTDTVSLSALSQNERYLLEIHVIKKQNYIKFDEPGITWKNLSFLSTPWWFEGVPSKALFIDIPAAKYEIEPAIRAELDRLKKDLTIDLGGPIGPVEEVQSAKGTRGQRQVFRQGEIYLHNDQPYAIFGPILDHYKDLGGHTNKRLGFPVSQMQTVTSTTGTSGTMMRFEGEGDPQPLSVIYASEKGVAAMWEWIDAVYFNEHGGHEGWLGFPLAGEQHYSDSTIQVFENGSIVYTYPVVEDDGERDWTRPPLASPHLTSRGVLVDVQAQGSSQGPWQETDVVVQAGELVGILQISGAWTYWENGDLFDANGNVGAENLEATLLPSAPLGSLVGKIGDNNWTIFPVGRWGFITAPVGGKLYLAMNDVDHSDNSGFTTVQITVD